jgi:hypothetical protein
MVEQLTAAGFVATLRSPAALDSLLACDHPLVVVDFEEAEPVETNDALQLLAPLPLVVAGIGAGAGSDAALADVVVDDDNALSLVDAGVRANPHAATALALLLRRGSGLAEESAVYSMLQAGPEFARWRETHPRRRREQEGPAVRVTREGDLLHVTLTRPHVHNALNAQMRDALYDAFTVAVEDPSVRVLLDGDGPSFCSGGDHDEFGTRPDPATAHLIRLRRSVGRLIATMRDRVEVVVHGASLGSGIELPSFAGRVVARPDARFALPELSLGLIPGAGGTVSLPQRIGRHRTAYLALSGATIDAGTALEWGLVNEIRDR